MKGCCKCGAISYTSGDALRLVNCHCSLCRSISGTAFTSYVVVASDTFAVSGEESLGSFAVTGRSTKYFCKTCGTPLYNVNPSTYPGLTMTYLGTLHDHHDILPGINIYCSSKLDWVDSVFAVRSFPEAPQRGA